MKKFLSVLLFVLLIACMLSASAEGLEAEEVFCPPVEAAVDEAGEYEIEGPADGAPAEAQQRGVSPWVDDTWNVYYGDTLTGYSGGPDVVIPAYITRIDSGAFRNNRTIENVQCEAGSQLTTIGSRAFYGCPYLKSVVMPDSVTSLGAEVFYLSSLEEITLSGSLTEIPDTAFAYAEITSITIPEGVTRIGKEAFKYCSYLQSVVLPSTLTEIGDDAFSNCTALKRVTLPDSLVSLGDGVFSGCTSLTSVNLPKRLTEIPARTFAGCGLTSFDVPDTVTAIGDSAFYGCKALASAALPDSVAALGTGVFDGCAALERVTLPKGIAAIPDYTFRESGLTKYSIPESVTAVGMSAFRGCARLTAIAIPDGVSDIGDYAFADCPVLKSATLPKASQTVNTMLFSNCAALESVKIPEGVWGIGDRAFEYCASLKNVVLPESVNLISILAFRGCTGLETVTIPGQSVSFRFYGTQNVTPFSACGDQLVIRCREWSDAYRFAKDHGINYEFIRPDKVTLKADGALELTPGGTVKLTAALKPSYSTSDLTWASSKPEVATVSYGTVTAVKAGKATITVTTVNGKTAKAKIKVTQSLSGASVTLKTQAYAYNGKARTPAVTVTLDGETLKKGTDYTVTYRKNISIGTATVTVKGKGYYTGTAKATFKINPKKVTGMKLTADAKKLTASWTKADGVTGFQIQYSLKSDFSTAKRLTVAKASATKKVISGLAAGKTYYVRVRAYKTVNGKKYWSEWSKAIKKKTN